MRGGLHLFARKQFPTVRSITAASVPPRLTLTLRSHEVAVEILVATGEEVLLGQTLARSKMAVLHAPVSGRIVAIEVDGALCTVTVENDGRDRPHAGVQPIVAPERLAPTIVRERIAQAGIVGLGGACFPTATKLDLASNSHVRLLIINGAECEPFIACDAALMREQAAEVVFGTKMLLHASGATRAIIAIESDKDEAIASIVQALAAEDKQRLSLQILNARYPTGGEHQLIELITGREVPTGGTPADIGVLCHNVGTAAAICRLVKSGEPLISRVITVTGHGISEPRNLLARLGTPIASLIADCGGYKGNPVKLILGGSMMGMTLPSDTATVSAATNCIVVALPQDLAPRGVEMPCIRCGDCATACPAGLLPQQLLRYAQAHDRAALNELGLRDCIECGCCDYVCPSQIPITAQLHKAKQAAP